MSARLGLRSAIPLKPCRHTLFVFSALGEPKKLEVSLFFGGNKFKAVDEKKTDGNNESSTLIAINKRMISSQTEGIGRSQPIDRW